MITLLLAIAAASQTPAPVKSSVDVCAEFGDFAYVMMEAFLTMLTDLCNIGLLPVKGHGPQGYEPKEHHL